MHLKGCASFHHACQVKSRDFRDAFTVELVQSSEKKLSSARGLL